MVKARDGFKNRNAPGCCACDIDLSDQTRFKTIQLPICSKIPAAFNGTPCQDTQRSAIPTESPSVKNHQTHIEQRRGPDSSRTGSSHSRASLFLRWPHIDSRDTAVLGPAFALAVHTLVMQGERCCDGEQSTAADSRSFVVLGCIAARAMGRIRQR